jgi:hypothetical protein
MQIPIWLLSLAGREPRFMSKDPLHRSMLDSGRIVLLWYTFRQQPVNVTNFGTRIPRAFDISIMNTVIGTARTDQNTGTFWQFYIYFPYLLDDFQIKRGTQLVVKLREPGCRTLVHDDATGLLHRNTRFGSAWSKLALFS